VKNSILGLLLLGALNLASCTTPYTPGTDRPFEPITEFTAQGAVALVNAQPVTEESKFGGGMSANYNAWTDVAIQIASRELSARGLTITPDAGRTLSLSVNEARYRTGWVKISTEIDMVVVTGDGYTGNYTSRNSSTMVAAPRRQVDGAMMRVVVAMLKDPEIIRYLTE
jgi:hypothetical protein